MEETEEDTRSQREVIIHTVILALTTALSVAGNSLVCVAFYRNRRLRTITNFYVLSLAIADLMMGVLVSPFNTVASGLSKWPYDYNFCQFTGFIAYYWSLISFCSLAMTSINRYFCVVKPCRYAVLFTKRKTALSIVSLWIFQFLFFLVFTIATPVIYKWNPNSLHCRGTALDEHTERITYVTFGCLFLVPMALVLFAYGRVYHVVRKHNRAIVPSLQEANSHRIITAQEIKASGVLFAAVLGFSVCWTPLIVTFILEFGFQVSIPSIAQTIYPLLSSFSSWINPIIYGVMNRPMRKEFRNILFGVKGN